MTAISLGLDDQLLCPFCGFDYTHIETVRVGARKEDDPVYLIAVEPSTARIEAAYSTEQPPSSRRSWVELIVDCEECPGGSIVIAQHKGQSFVSTRPNLTEAPAAPPF
ncbi:hypothetical protein ACQPXM_06605 [Kribbella sp. CA-253562]|uniref:hypothetical protein n=1 Tax=Kribbella sp. CA-253562 TaxID=3239942 RepID=UPI003D908CF7